MRAALVACSLATATAFNTGVGCSLKPGDGCKELRTFAGCMHEFCSKGSRTPLGNKDGLEGLETASDFREKCHEISSQLPSCTVDCDFTNCEWGHHVWLGVVCCILLTLGLSYAAYTFATANREEWNWPECYGQSRRGIPMGQSQRHFTGVLCVAPCTMSLALVYTMAITDSTFDILMWIFICPCIIGCALFRDPSPNQVDQQENPTSGPYAPLPDEQGSGETEGQNKQVQVMLEQAQPTTAVPMNSPPPYVESQTASETPGDQDALPKGMAL